MAKKSRTVLTAYRLRNKKTGEFYQRNGHFGKTPRLYSNLGHLKNSMNSAFDMNEVWTDLIIEEVQTVITNILNAAEWYEEREAELQIQKDKKDAEYKRWRATELQDELNKLKY